MKSRQRRAMFARLNNIQRFRLQKVLPKDKKHENIIKKLKQNKKLNRKEVFQSFNAVVKKRSIRRNKSRKDLIQLMIKRKYV